MTEAPDGRPSGPMLTACTLFCSLLSMKYSAFAVVVIFVANETREMMDSRTAEDKRDGDNIVREVKDGLKK